MPTRIHVASFIGFTIVVWLLALWIQGMPVLSRDFIRPFGLVVGASMGVAAVFNKYAWSWWIFRGWYIKRPDIRGTWQAELRSNWNPQREGESDEDPRSVEAYVVVRQTLMTLSMRLFTEESQSRLVAHSLELEEDELWVLNGIYRNEPRIELQGVRSEIHHGAFALRVHGNPPRSLEGHYWTDRKTKGSMKLHRRLSRVCDNYADASDAFKIDSPAAQKSTL
jgi:hypothetical protein